MSTSSENDEPMSDTDRVSEGSVCAVCGRTFAPTDVRPWISVRPSLSALIARDVPNWGEADHICRDDLVRYRHRHAAELLRAERGELGPLDRQVLDSIERGELVAQEPDTTPEEDERMAFGDRMSDRVATFGGSWTFILSFCAVLVVWMALNASAVLFKPFDPYPFILLNLVLSCVAAMQAPIIMMSQRRQETKDRQRAENDYRVNLKAELEIRLLHEKLDHQMARQWERLAELQSLQIDLLEERGR